MYWGLFLQGTKAVGWLLPQIFFFNFSERIRILNVWKTFLLVSRKAELVSRLLKVYTEEISCSVKINKFNQQ